MQHSSDSVSGRSENLLSPVSSSSSKLTRSVSGSSARSGRKFRPAHKHNDYSCYIQLLNRTGSTLRLVDAKAGSGHWAVGSPPQEIEPHAEIVIELTDPKGPHGSEGFCAYRLDHPGRTRPVSFGLKFADPYWGGDENYLHATTQYSEWISLNVLDYAASGHPFTATVEVGTLQGERRAIGTSRDESTGERARPKSSSTVSTGSSRGSLPSYDSRHDVLGEPQKEPINIITPVDIKVDHSGSDDESKEVPKGSITSKEAEDVEAISQPEPTVEDKQEAADQEHLKTEGDAAQAGQIDGKANTKEQSVSDVPSKKQPAESSELIPGNEEDKASQEKTKVDGKAEQAGQILDDIVTEKVPAGAIGTPVDDQLDRVSKENTNGEDIAEQAGEMDVQNDGAAGQAHHKAIPVEEEIKHEAVKSEPAADSMPESMSSGEAAQVALPAPDPVAKPQAKSLPSDETAPAILPVSEPITQPKETPSEETNKGETAKRSKDDVQPIDLKHENDIDDDYVEVEKPDTGNADTGAAVTPAAGYWWDVFSSHHGKIGIAALLFLACYGVTASNPFQTYLKSKQYHRYPHSRQYQGYMDVVYKLSDYIQHHFQYSSYIDMDSDAIQAAIYAGLQPFWITVLVFETVFVCYLLLNFLVGGVGKDAAKDLDTA